MRTTLTIDDDVLLAAKELAAAKKTTTGHMLSELARRSLQGDTRRAGRTRNGFDLLPAGGQVVTPEMIGRLLEEED